MNAIERYHERKNTVFKGMGIRKIINLRKKAVKLLYFVTGLEVNK